MRKFIYSLMLCLGMVLFMGPAAKSALVPGKDPVKIEQGTAPLQVEATPLAPLAFEVTKPVSLLGLPLPVSGKEATRLSQGLRDSTSVQVRKRVKEKRTANNGCRCTIYDVLWQLFHPDPGRVKSKPVSVSS